MILLHLLLAARHSEVVPEVFDVDYFVLQQSGDEKQERCRRRGLLIDVALQLEADYEAYVLAQFEFGFITIRSLVFDFRAHRVDERTEHIDNVIYVDRVQNALLRISHLVQCVQLVLKTFKDEVKCSVPTNLKLTDCPQELRDYLLSVLWAELAQSWSEKHGKQKRVAFAFFAMECELLLVKQSMVDCVFVEVVMEPVQVVDRHHFLS
mmetsp:Transcript_41512/g.63369  ORF Transcript_41512/g.63369 Transcript_41512/m.63369 type:complete len:208 (+) Transcript_41512:2388-3011(+)